MHSWRDGWRHDGTDLVVDVKTLQQSEEERAESARLGRVPKGGRPKLSEVERVVADLVRRANGEPPAW